MAGRQTYHLVCDGCSTPYTPLLSFPAGPQTSERALVVRTIAEVRAEARLFGWVSFVVFATPRKPAAKTIDHCPACVSSVEDEKQRKERP